MAIKKLTGYCKTCGRPEYVWKKRIISTAVASLCQLVRMYKGEPIHLDEFNVLQKDRNFSQLALWGLVITKKDPEKRSSGMWEPTTRGIWFAKHEGRVMEYVVTKNNRIVKFEPPMITVKQALGKRFDYRVLMGLNRQGQRVDAKQRRLWNEMPAGQVVM